MQARITVSIIGGGQLKSGTRCVGQRYVSQDDLTHMMPYTTADILAFVDIPGRDLWWDGLEKMRVTSGFEI